MAPQPVRLFISSIGLAGIYLLSGCQTSRETAPLALQVTPAPVPHSSSETVTLYGGKGNDFLRTIRCQHDTCSLYGGTDGSFTRDEDYLVIRTRLSGQAIWARAYGGTNRDELRTAVATRDGGALLVGESASLFYTSLKIFSPHKWPRPLLVRIDAQGKIQWAATAELSGPTWRLQLEKGIQTPNGGFLLAGSYKDWTNSPAENSVRTQQWLINGKVYSAPPNAPRDAILIRLDAEGELEWLKRYRLSDEKYAHFSGAWAMLPQSGGGFRIALYDGSDARIVLMSINGKGEPLDAQTLEGVGDSAPDNLHALPGGGYLLFAHTFKDKTVRSTLTAEFDKFGKLLDVRRYTKPGFAPLQAARRTADGSYCIAGRNGSGTQSRAGALLLSTHAASSKTFSLDANAATEFFGTTAIGDGRCLMGGSTIAFGAAGADILTFTWQPQSEGKAGPRAETMTGAHMQKADVTAITLEPRRVIHFIPPFDIRITKIPVPTPSPASRANPAKTSQKKPGDATRMPSRAFPRLHLQTASGA